jgi:hypothetical protein
MNWGTSHRARLRLLLTVLLFAGTACSGDQSGLELCDDGVCVRLSLEPFQMQVFNRDNDLVLSTALPGGAPEYRPLSAQVQCQAAAPLGQDRGGHACIAYLLFGLARARGRK